MRDMHISMGASECISCMNTYAHAMCCNAMGNRPNLKNIGDHALEGVHTAHAVALNQAVHLHIAGHDVISVTHIS